MPWARLEDNYFTHRKVADLSKDAKLLDLAAIAFSARELRDGDLSRSDVRIVAAEVDVDDFERVAEQLVTAGRWGKSDTGYIIHDYLKYNPSREKVLKERESGAKRLAEWRAKHPKQTRKPAAARNGVTNAVRTPNPGPGPGPGLETRSPDPVPNPEPGDARATRDGSVTQIGSRPSRKRPLPGVPMVHEGDGFNEDLAMRIQAIGEELADDNIASSITRAQRYQSAFGLDDGTMANAVKDAHRRSLARLNDLSRAPPGSPMAYFLAILEQTTQERATT